MKFFYFMFFTILLSSCGSSSNFTSSIYQVYFIGNVSNAPTTQVTVFLSDTMIKRSYTVLGEAGLSNTALNNKQMIFNSYIDKAKAVGADGVLFLRDENIRQWRIKYNAIRNGYTDLIHQVDTLSFYDRSMRSYGSNARSSTGLDYEYVYFIKYN